MEHSPSFEENPCVLLTYLPLHKTSCTKPRFTEAFGTRCAICVTRFEARLAEELRIELENESRELRNMLFEDEYQAQQNLQTE